MQVRPGAQRSSGPQFSSMPGPEPAAGAGLLLPAPPVEPGLAPGAELLPPYADPARPGGVVEPVAGTVEPVVEPALVEPVPPALDGDVALVPAGPADVG